jgi:phage tail-like protein
MPIDADASVSAGVSAGASAGVSAGVSAGISAGGSSDDADARTATPFTTFNFRVRIDVDGDELCSAAFSECNGLEMTMEAETHREGGNNVTEHQLVGQVSYGQLTLKRGMTKTYDLWKWFNDANRTGGSGGYDERTRIRVEMLASDRGDTVNESDVTARFTLHRCLPVKMRAPSLAASDGGVAIEELQVAYERLQADIPGAPDS